MLLKIRIELFFLFRRQNVVNLVLGFHTGKRHRFMLRFHFIDLRFRFRLSKVSLAISSCIARRSSRDGRFMFSRWPFMMSRICCFCASGQVQPFEHHFVLAAMHSFMVHHRFAFGSESQWYQQREPG
ncbi:Uncharacterised protein [Raoultella planticola]|uniref:Uncharacterized protein n=1 Tax=Raoultella planticola TaxID=575 RepID=A0A485CEE9_RAOPL|nr:Uncharacterised protein [Raoultella planticola]